MRAGARRSRSGSATTSISWSARRSSSRSTSAPKSGRRSSTSTRSSCAARRRRRTASACCCASASCSDEDRRRRQGVRRLRARVPRGSVDDDGAHRARAAGHDLRGVAAARVAVRGGDREAQARGRRSGAAARAAHQGRRGVRREAREAGEGDRVLPPRAGDRSRRSRRRSRRSSGSSRATSVGPSCSRSIARRSSCRPSRRRASRSTSAWRTCGRRCSATSTRRSRRTRRCSARDSANVKALKALDRLYLGQQAVARARRQPHAAAPAHRRQAGDDSRCWCASRSCASASSARSRRRSTPIGRCSISIATTTRRCAALERLVSLPDHELQVATILEPIYKARDEWQKLVGTYEILVRHSMDPARKIELLHQIGDLYEMGGEDARGVPHLRSRAARGAGAQGDADAARAAGAHARSLEGPRVLVRLGHRAGGQVVGRRRAADAAA